MATPRVAAARAAAARPVPAPLCIVVHAPREHVRALARAAFPRRRARLVLVRTAAEAREAFRAELVDLVLVDLGAPQDEAWRVAELARDFPSAPCFAVLPLRAADAPALARCVGLELAGVLIEGVDDPVVRDLVAPHAFALRFARALEEPPPALGLATALQRRVWTALVAHVGRPVQTEALAAALGMTREHLSRTFAEEGAPNLKRVIDLVRVLAAAELAKNPGYDVRDVAGVLGFASPSHLASTAQRVVGTRPASLARLRTIDLVERFAQGRSRSRS